MKPGAGEDPFADDSDPPREDESTEAVDVVEEPVDAREAFVERMVDELDAIDDGKSKTMGVRDANWMAFFRALDLDESPEVRQELARAFSERLNEDVDPNDIDVSEVLRLSLKATLPDILGERDEQRLEAIAEYARRNA